MHAGERHFRGAHEVILIRFAQTVDLVGVRIEEAGATHHFRAHERRRDREHEVMLLRLVHGHREHGDLQARDVAAQEVEARTAHLHTALHVDARDLFAERQVVLRFEALGREIADRADLLDHHIVVLTAFGGLRLHDVRQLPHGGGVFLVRAVRVRLIRRDLLGKLLRLGDQRGLLVGRGLGDLLADLFLLGARLLELLERGAAHFVGTQYLIHQFHGLATLALRFLDDLGMFANELNIKHEHQSNALSRQITARFPRLFQARTPHRHAHLTPREPRVAKIVL